MYITSRIRQSSLSLALALAMLAGSGAAQADTSLLPRPTVVAYASGDAREPYGWVDFCKRFPADCAVSTREPEAVRLDAQTWKTIQTINARINSEIQPITDMAHWGIVERWDYPTDGMGDCEDYALLKRKRLVEAGIPRRALLITVVVDEENEGHAVLMLRTDRGDYILDNKRGAILPWTQTGYVFVKRERQDRIGWTSLGGVTSSAITAAR
jgi:predicted transglutaminase-like cysteine proteinase